DGSIFVTDCALNIFNTKNKEDLTPNRIGHKFEDTSRFKSLLDQLITKAIAFDEVFETNDSTTRYVRAVAKPILKGDKIFKISGVYQDVTDIWKKENDLILYKTIIDNAQDLIYVYND